MHKKFYRANASCPTGQQSCQCTRHGVPKISDLGYKKDKEKTVHGRDNFSRGGGRNSEVISLFKMTGSSPQTAESRNRVAAASAAKGRERAGDSQGRPIALFRKLTHPCGPKGLFFHPKASPLKDYVGGLGSQSCLSAAGGNTEGKASSPEIIPVEYFLETFHRSNQDTCLVHKPAVFEGDWVQAGDLLADCASSIGGELSLGHNILIAYMPWEGFNYEDAILISERLVFDDVYSSIHIERYETDVRETRYGKEQITFQIPDVSPKKRKHLNSYGISKIGTFIQEGEILVGKITPINQKYKTHYKTLLHSIVEKEFLTFQDSSLRAPKGINAKVVNIFLSQSNPIHFTRGAKASKSLPRRGPRRVGKAIPRRGSLLLKQEIVKLRGQLLSLGAPKKDSVHCSSAGGKVEIGLLHTLRVSCRFSQRTRPLLKGGCFSLRVKLLDQNQAQPRLTPLRLLLPTGDTFRGLRDYVGVAYPWLPLRGCNFTRGAKAAGVASANVVSQATAREPVILQSEICQNKKPILFEISNIQIYLAEKRKVQIGDKMAGRHGNKGIVSQILPREDMPYLKDGSTVDMVLNPLGVPSRMNVGQIYECLLGLAGKYLGTNFRIIPFDETFGAEASRSFVFSKLFEARKKTGKKWLFNPNYPGKTRLFDGRTGEAFDQPVTVGQSYMLKLVHLVDDKIHSRSTGSYSLVTQQPLRGRSKQGGQRLGEMEVWAIEGYGAAFILLELLTIKSDNISGRLGLWSHFLLNRKIAIGTPESFHVLVSELQSLCLEIGLFL
jgi:DNA-directed RNA polymerase subunit beta